jgi:hypothetical protein
LVTTAFARRPAASRERGATLFVVVLVITLLTGIGLYTVHSAGLVAQASGNGRQALQTEHLAQLGALSTMSQLVQNAAVLGAADERRRVAEVDDQERCASTEGVDTTQTGRPFCLELTSEDPANFPLAGSVPLFTPESFGMAIDPETGNAPIVGRFHTETTEMEDAGPVAGSSVGSGGGQHVSKYKQVKITATAQLFPAGALVSNACVENMTQVTGQHMTRAHVIVGPLTQ